MIEYLLGRKNSINTLEQLIQAVKHAPIREKRFHALHAYSKVILGIYVFIAPTKGLEIVQKMCFMFRDLECKYQRQNVEGRAFINYKWLLHYFFDKMNIPQLKPYIPIMKCKRRRRFYTKLVKKLYA